MTSNYINNSINQIAGAEEIKKLADKITQLLDDQTQLTNSYKNLDEGDIQTLISNKGNLVKFLTDNEEITKKLSEINPENISVNEKSDEKKKYRMAVKYSAQPLFIPPPFRTNFNPLGSAVPQVAMTFKPEYELEEVKDKSDA